MKCLNKHDHLTKYIVAAISIYFYVFQCISANSQTDSLYSYLEIAAKNNPTVLQRYYEYQAAVQKVPQVGSLQDPTLNVGVFLKPMELVAGNQVADIQLMQMLPWFGLLKNAKDEMSLMANAKLESLRDAKSQVFLDVQRSWYEMHKVRQNIRISQKNIEILQTIERLAIVRFKAGPSSSSQPASGNAPAPVTSQASSSGSSGMNTMSTGSGSSAGSVSSQSSSAMPGNPMASSSGSSGLTDVYRIQIEISDVQNNIELLKNQLNTLTSQFNSYLNRPPESPVTLPDTLIVDNFQLSLLALSDTALSNNPMLGMLQFEQKSLEARKQMVTKMGYPMVGFGLAYTVIQQNPMSTSSMNGKDMIMPMVTATLPIYRKKYNAMKAEADLLKSATAQNYVATANGLKTEYYQAIQLNQDAHRRIKLYADQNRLASKSLDIMFRSFASAGTNLTDIMRVRQQTLDYEYKQMEAIADYNTSIAWLKRLMAFSQVQ